MNLKKWSFRKETRKRKEGKSKHKEKKREKQRKKKKEINKLKEKEGKWKRMKEIFYMGWKEKERNEGRTENEKGKKNESMLDKIENDHKRKVPNYGHQRKKSRKKNQKKEDLMKKYRWRKGKKVLNKRILLIDRKLFLTIIHCAWITSRHFIFTFSVWLHSFVILK